MHLETKDRVPTHAPAIGLSSAGRHTLCMADGEPWPCRTEQQREQPAPPLDVERLRREIEAMRAFEHDGDFVREARPWHPDSHYVNRQGVLSILARLGAEREE